MHEELQILVQNETDSLIHVKLYPIKTAPTTVSLYPICEGCGGYNLAEFNLPPPNDGFYDNDMLLFLSNDIHIQPYTLAAKAFDSIYISTVSTGKVIIRFTHESVTGYSENIFAENATWDFSIEEWDAQTQLRKNPVRSYCYRFLILKNKIIIE